MALSPTSPPRGPSRLIDTSLEMGAFADSDKSLGHSALRWLTADGSTRFFFHGSRPVPDGARDASESASML